MALIPTTAAQIAEFADALYGIELGNATYTFVNNDVTLLGGLNNTLNAFYTFSYGGNNAAAAAAIVNNVGIIAGKSGLTAADVTTAVNYVLAQLNANPGKEGQIVNSILNSFANMTGDAVYGAAATAWVGNIQVITQYMGVSTNTTDIPLAPGVALSTATDYNLTTGIDNIAPAGNSTINGVIGTSSTFNALDSIKATGTNNTLNIADQTTAAISTFPMVTVTGVQTVNIQSTSAPQLDTSGWTGLTALNIAASTGADVIKVASTAASTLTDTLATGTVAGTTINTTVDGGTTATVTATGSTSGANVVIGNVTVGGTSAPTGNVTVTATETSNLTASTFGNVSATSGAGVTINNTENAGVMNDGTSTVTAGTISGTAGTGALNITSTANITDTTAAAVATFTMGAISANGGSSIVVTENATASAAALAANPGAAGVAGTKTLTVTQGEVTALDGGSATSVTINQAATATAVGAKGAVSAAAAVVTPGGPGYSAVTTTAAVSAAALVPATLGVANGVDIVAGASVGTALANASATITTVSLNNYAAGSYVNSTALTSLTLAGNGAGVTVYNNATTPFTSLNLNLNGLTDATGLTVGSVKTLNVTTGSADSTLGAITDTSLATLNVAGTNTLTDTLTASQKIAVAVSGAAGFNDNGSFAGTAAGSTITTTSSGTITATLHNTGTDTFTGSTGQDIITITVDQTKAVAGGSATNNELVLNAAATTFLSGTGHTWADVTGFSILGLNTASTGTYNAGAMGSNTFNSVDVMGAVAGATTIDNLVQGSSLSVDATQTKAITLQTIDTGSSDSSTINLGTSANGAVTVFSLSLGNANGVGFSTLNIVSNDTAANAGGVNTITTLVDSGLSTLNVSGVDGLTINTLDEGATLGSSATAATSFTVNNTSGAAVTIGTLTDSALGNLTFTGSGNDVITTLTTSATSHALTVSNTGTGTASIGTFTADAALTSLTLSGSVALNGDANPLAASTATGATTGVTVAAGTDNAHINLNLTGAAATDSITVGNANNFITDGSTAGTVNITAGTGANFINIAAGTQATPAASTYAASARCLKIKGYRSR